MAFSTGNLETKLNALNETQAAIQSVSLWIMHHRRHASESVDTWFEKLCAVDASKKLAYMFVANDVLQNARKHGTEFTEAFRPVLIDAFAHVAGECEPPVVKSLNRVLTVWQDRSLYPADFVAQLKSALNSSSSESSSATASTSAAASQVEKRIPQPVDPDALALQLRQIQDAVVSDTLIQQRVTVLPVSSLKQRVATEVKDHQSGTYFQDQVSQGQRATLQLMERLEAQTKQRKRVIEMLQDALALQNQAVAKLAETAKECQEKMDTLNAAETELNSIMKSLPSIGYDTSSYSRLPSTSELFSRGGSGASSSRSHMPYATGGYASGYQQPSSSSASAPAWRTAPAVQPPTSSSEAPVDPRKRTATAAGFEQMGRQ
ncbi:hypothetical protein CAOG_06798 [Capsaspora owczarzaki ATCC 30864]|uniref:CID domain-containing protein n=1 Tax=Capsaspora owczarzaki (strain ATCC 30864) TaxID=595528 RepID=A0A0D2WUT8_CAPO3|nr:hypothetical protein CAOG_06798 [Capsaspora owczarzaki ATCC 30864]KJE96475.1 hypothetical protein CAOG_006798 [Capsaspora owczarzaki ATCC 30864]|eukprot:XP_004344419.1 hypothetical protein CAOG_06798 [Capsaspora owczarzaki ATCC 30864]